MAAPVLAILAAEGAGAAERQLEAEELKETVAREEARRLEIQRRLNAGETFVDIVLAANHARQRV